MSLFKWIEKNPLEAAALGTAAYFTGGAALGAMGGAGAGATGAAAAVPGMTAAQAAVPITEGVFAGATPAGLLAANGGGAAATSGGLSSLMGYAQPAMQSMQAASLAKGLFSEPQSQQVQAPAPQGANPQGSQTLAQLYQQGMQPSPEDQARMQRKTMWG